MINNIERKPSFIKYIVMILISLIVLFPLVNILIVSISYPKELAKDFFSFTKHLNLSNYVDAWVKGKVPQYFFNTALVLVCSIGMIIIAASLSAYAIKRYKSKLIQLTYYVLLCGMFIPIQAVILPLFKSLKAVGLIDNLFGLSIVYAGMNLPLAMMMFTGFFKGIPNELIDAARIDGCGSFKIYLRIIMPLSKTIISTVTILSGLMIWRDFFIPLVIITDPTKKTMSVGLLAFVNEFSLDWTRLCAGMVIQTLPILILFLALQRYFVGGIVAGAVKG